MLTGPRNTTLCPYFILSILFESEMTFCISVLNFLISFFKLEVVFLSSKSSENSISALITAFISCIFFFHFNVGFFLNPKACLFAMRSWFSDSAAIKLLTPSKYIRFFLLFKKLLSENSPGFAGTKFFSLESSSISFLITTIPPCICISKTSSPVKEFGFLKYIASPSSNTFPFLSISLQKFAYLGLIVFKLQIFLATNRHSGPETLTMATDDCP